MTNYPQNVWQFNMHFYLFNWIGGMKNEKKFTYKSQRI